MLAEVSQTTAILAGCCIVGNYCASELFGPHASKRTALMQSALQLVAFGALVVSSGVLAHLQTMGAL